jgi:hypothetical protein
MNKKTHPLSSKCSKCEVTSAMFDALKTEMNAKFKEQDNANEEMHFE